jgi:hypothetical protein
MTEVNVFPPQPEEFTLIFDRLRALPNGLAFGYLGETGLAVAQAVIVEPNMSQILAATASTSGQFPTAYMARLEHDQVAAGMAADARQKGHGLDPDNPGQLLAAFEGKTFNLVGRGRRVRSIFDKLAEISTDLLEQ